jgi:drug/metabolite transporter (DMT)-like permease
MSEYINLYSLVIGLVYPIASDNITKYILSKFNSSDNKYIYLFNIVLGLIAIILGYFTFTFNQVLSFGLTLAGTLLMAYNNIKYWDDMEELVRIGVISFGLSLSIIYVVMIVKKNNELYLQNFVKK